MANLFVDSINIIKKYCLQRTLLAVKKFEFMVDAISGAPWAPNKATRDPEYKNLPSTVARCEIATRNVKLTQYWYNFDLLYKLAEQLPSESPRRAKIIYTLNKSVDAFDYTHTDESLLEKVSNKGQQNT